MVPDIVNKFTSKNDDDYDEDENINDLVVKKRNKCIKYIINNKDRKKDA